MDEFRGLFGIIVVVICTLAGAGYISMIGFSLMAMAKEKYSEKRLVVGTFLVAAGVATILALIFGIYWVVQPLAVRMLS